MIRQLDERSIEVNLPTKLGYERIAMECSAAFAKIMGFVPERVEDIKTVVAEACLNAIEHGNKGRPDARVVVTMRYEDKSIKIAVADEGDGLIEFPEEPDIEKKLEMLETPRGLGIFIMKRLADELEFNKEAGKGHVVKLELRQGG